MKKLLLISLLPLFIYSQTPTKSIVELKQQIKTEVDRNNSVQLQSAPEKKKAGIAILYSLLLPGMGELYAERYDSGIYFTVADAVFWGGVAGLNIYGNWKENSYRSFAESNGGVTLDGKDEKYFANIGIYVDIDQYNEVQELSRNYDEIYDEETYYWSWEDNTQRSEYRSMWTSAESAYNNVRFAVGALILNRVVSAINAVRFVSAYNNKIDELSWNVSVGMTNHPTLPSSINLNFTTSF